MPHPTNLAIWATLAAAALLLLAEATRRLLDNPRGDIPAGFYWRATRIYSRLVHRLRVHGAERLRGKRHPGPLILVANHTAGVDPVLIQASLNFEPRWVMAQDMRVPGTEWLWDYGRIIFVDRQKGDLAGTREALRHLKSGGVLGIFPEGRIERPARTLLPFQPGVGFIIKRSGAPVLPVVIEGTPEAPSAWGTLYKRSRATLRYLETIDYSKTSLSAEQITQDLLARFQTATGWPVNENAG